MNSRILLKMKTFTRTKPLYTTACRSSTITTDNMENFITNLTAEQRHVLLCALHNSENSKAQYKGELASFRWRSKFGRPSSISSNENADRLSSFVPDATGSFCPLPDQWFSERLSKNAETIQKPTRSQLIAVGLHNAVPFIGFGFLDNSIMIICGDSIESTLGSIITISTMAAAALGNTFSDILGIGSAYYVESAAAKLGLVKQPQLTQHQMNTSTARFAANLGRTIGVTVGCLLGMFPLLFKSSNNIHENAE